MRTDNQIGAGATKDDDLWNKNYAGWRESKEEWKQRLPNSHPAMFPLSGGERDHLFLSSHAEQFTDVAGLSALDSPGDGRGFVVWDYDRDGWSDVAVASANAPTLSIYRNQLGRVDQGKNRFVAVRMVGGSRAAAPSSEWSSRDGYGALVKVKVGEHTLTRVHSCGEGFAAQNSATLLIGIGEHDVCEWVSVHWPSGKETGVVNVPAGTLLTLYEDPSQTADGQGFVAAPYLSSRGPSRPPEQKPTSAPVLTFAAASSPEAASRKLNVYVTMATWCVACKKEAPQIERIRRTFAPDEVGVFGVPTDPNDTEEMLEKYVDDNRPPYRLIQSPAPESIATVQQVLKEIGRTDALPSTIVTDGSGRVLWAGPGVPSVSELRKLLAP